MKWHRNIPPAVFYVFGVLAIILLFTNPFFLLLIVLMAAGVFAVGGVLDFFEDLGAKRRDRKEKGRDSRLR